MFRNLALSIFIISLTLCLGISAFAKWENQCESDPELYIQGIQFLDENKGFAVGTGGVFLTTVDGGAKWTKKVIQEVKQYDIFIDFYDVCFADEKNGWISGDMYKASGAILYTKDGGKTWDRQVSGAAVALYGIYFLNAKNGFAIGGNGTILGTDSSGAKWTSVSGGSASAEIGGGASGFWDIKFVTPQIGWVVGENGAIKKTSDGGKTWVAQTSGTDSNLSACDFVTENVGWAVGEGAVIVNTTDGGKTWTAQKSGLSEEWFYDVDFINENEGLVVGDYGTILRTKDGGKTWTVERSRKQKGVDNLTFYGISMLKPGLAFAAGQFGAILKFMP